jgi:hypothetical protein
MRSRVELTRSARLCLALGGAAVVAGLVTSWSAKSVRKVASPSAQIVGQRLARNDPAPPDRQRPFDSNLYFRPPSSLQLTSVPSQFLPSIPARQVSEYGNRTTANAPFLRPAPSATRSSLVEHDRDRLFNDAQVASIEARLKLDVNQRDVWHPVESALRAIRWTHDGAHKERTLDLNSDEIKRLKTAAVPLITTLREDQREEIRTLTRLMGLEKLASQF